MAVVVVKAQAPLLLSAADKLGATGGEKGDNNWRILHGDSLALLPQLPDASADLIFADPPYNLQLKKALYRPNGTEVEGVNDEWDKFSSFEEYDDFCRKWLTECRRLLSPRGSLWAIGTYHNIFRIGRLMQDAGFWLLNDVIWHKTNPMPNFRGVRFTNATETLLWAKKSEKARCVFNNKLMKAENNGKQMPNVWRIPLCGGKERLRDNDGNKLHSTQKPLELLRRIILSSTTPGDIILDPFMGSGTTMAAAQQTGRKSCGIERDQKYIPPAKTRITATTPEIHPAASLVIPAAPVIPA
ncbi:MAG: DNA-methyltransferase [Gammaproteobacteria bacterium]